jgi:hypothetical protein
MANYKTRWQEKQARRVERSPWLRLDRATLVPDKQGYVLTITGFGLQAGPVPPEVMVGGIPAMELRFSADRRILTGRLERLPASDEVTVNLGPGLQGKGTLEFVRES